MDVDFTQLGAAAGAVAVVYLFLKDRQNDRKTWENHLSGTVQVLSEIKQGQNEHRKRTEKED